MHFSYKTVAFLSIVVMNLLSICVESSFDQEILKSNDGGCSANNFCTACVSSSFNCDWCIDSRSCHHSKSYDCKKRFVSPGTTSKKQCSVSESCDLFKTYHDCIESSQFYDCGWCISKNHCASRARCSISGDTLLIRKSDILNNSLFEIVDATRLKFGEPENILLRSRTEYSYESLVQAGFKCLLTFENPKLNFAVLATIEMKETGAMVSCLLPQSNKILLLENYTATANLSLYTNITQIHPIWDSTVTFFDCRAYFPRRKCMYGDPSCYWCADEEKCIYRNRRKIVCPSSPSSWINSFWPEKGPRQGGTNITIRGADLNIKFENYQNAIKVAGRPCKSLKYEDVSPKKITCTIEPSSSSQFSEGKIKVHADEEVIWSKTNFMFVEPNISDFHPKQGFISGGTQLTIKGQHLDAGSSIIVYIGSQPCTIFFYNSSTIQCVSNKSNTTAEEDMVSVVFDEYVIIFTNNSYKYIKDEEHDENGFNVQPKGIPNGGIQIMLRNVISEQSNESIFSVNYQNNIHNGSCKFQGDSTVICSSPQIPISSNSINAANPKKLNFWLTGLIALEPNNFIAENQSSTFLLYPSPKFHYFSISYVPLNKNHYVIIEGDNINKACQKSDFIVKMGNATCDVISLSSIRVICILSKSNSSDCTEVKCDVEENENVMITIGNNFTASVSQKRSSPSEQNNPIQKNTIYYIFGISIAILLIIPSCICFFCHWRMRAKNVLETKAMEQRVNQMCMEAITLRQYIKKIIIENKVEIDEDSSNMLKLPNITIEYGLSALHTQNTVDRSSDPEYLIPIDHKWEFLRSNLSFGKCLGEGEFGKVFAAEAFGILQKNLTSTVAVKSLKRDIHSDANMIDLVSELEIMKLIGSHKNVLQLLGCCTQGGELLIITEFAQNGNLRDFLRNYLPSSEDKLMDLPNNLTQKTLLLFAQQVGEGMEYLASIKCVHRDLAARNVLVSDDYILKISDFGLARDIQNKEYYRMETKGRLPVKWMAPEALGHGRYTTQSDVWSYGILLWEILTLGATPYPSLQNLEKLFHILHSGYRMEKPPNCSVEMYSLMQKCWSLLPKDRPTFTMIVDILSDVLSNTNDETLDLCNTYSFIGHGSGQRATFK